MSITFSNKGTGNKDWSFEGDFISVGLKKIRVDTISRVEKTKDEDSDGNIKLDIYVRSTTGQEFFETALHARKDDEEKLDSVIGQILKDENDENDFYNESLDPTTYTFASGENLPYVVLQVTLKEKLIGTGSVNLTELESIINKQVRRGYRLHTITTVESSSKGLAGGDRIQATLVFERLDMRQF